MKKMMAGFNANTILIMIVSGLICYMQKKVLDAVWEIPALVYRVDIMQEQIKQEKRDREDADEKKQQQIKMLWDALSKKP